MNNILEKSMWTVCWEDSYGKRHWELISGEDTMHQRVNELVKFSGGDEVVVGKIIWRKEMNKNEITDEQKASNEQRT
jgi:hypothetical protein